MENKYISSRVYKYKGNTKVVVGTLRQISKVVGTRENTLRKKLQHQRLHPENEGKGKYWIYENF